MNGGLQDWLKAIASQSGQPWLITGTPMLDIWTPTPDAARELADMPAAAPGAAAHVAQQLALLGVRTWFVCPPPGGPGAELVRLLELDGVELLYTDEPPQPPWTARRVVGVDAASKAIRVMERRDERPEQISVGPLDWSAILPGTPAACIVVDHHPPGAPPERWINLCGELMDRGVPVAVDSRHHLGAYPPCTLIMPNENEWRKLTGESIWDGQGRLRRRVRRPAGPEEIVVTLGARGFAIIHAREETEHMETHPVRAVSDVGAGDVALAAAFSARVAGAPLREALRFAAEITSRAVQRPGTVLWRPEDGARPV
ncbi:MAG: Bifunctional protein HldE [Myxococcota bacterium]|nr:Bifunctional protein HldE [Myxococcota bacterium]